jgi:hypothetical protein
LYSYKVCHAPYGIRFTVSTENQKKAKLSGKNRKGKKIVLFFNIEQISAHYGTNNRPGEGEWWFFPRNGYAFTANEI